MDATTLPSHYRKPSSEKSEQEATLCENDPFQGTGRISPTTLAYASQCTLRGVWRAMGEKGIGPSPFTQSVMDDGKEYEKRMLDPEGIKIWVTAINQTLGLELQKKLPKRECTPVKMTKSETPQDFFERTKKSLQTALPPTSSEAFFIHEPRLASLENGALLQGMPDLMVWTGKQWILADLKCSEEAKRAHGMQITAYARMLKAMRPSSNIHPTGVIIHCAPGYRYTATSTSQQKDITLSHSQATPFPLESLMGAMDEAIEILTNPGAETLALEEAVFSSVCVECEFRFRCYPRFLQQRHVSLAPLMKAEIEAVMNAGITTIDGLIATIDDPECPAYVSLLDLKDGSPLQLGYLRKKAERILEKGLYTKWRASPEELKKPLFFVAVETDAEFYPPLKNNSKDSEATCLVVYSERERRVAWAKIFAAGVKFEKISVFVVSEIIQKYVHGLIPSITLRPLATMLKTNPSLEDFSRQFPEPGEIQLAEIEKSIADSTTARERMVQLKCVWESLNSSSISFSL